MSELNYLTLLKTNLVSFFDSLIELLPNEGDFLIIRFFIKDKIPTIDIMNYVINKLLPLKSLIEAKNDAFFLNNNILFEQLDKNKVNYFKNIWQEKYLDDKDKDVIWSWFLTFVKIAELYKKKVSKV
jgi:hypothetical protein